MSEDKKLATRLLESSSNNGSIDFVLIENIKNGVNEVIKDYESGKKNEMYHSCQLIGFIKRHIHIYYKYKEQQLYISVSLEGPDNIMSEETLFEIRKFMKKEGFILDKKKYDTPFGYNELSLYFMIDL